MNAVDSPVHLPRGADAAAAALPGMSADVAPLDDPGARLLEQVLVRCRADATPTILLLPCHGSALLVGGRLAAAAAALLGRTLLADAAGGDENSLPAHRLATRRDARVPALHHTTISASVIDQIRTGQPIANEFEAISRAFRLVAIVCAAAGASAQALALAPLCSGTLLLVQAGQTRLADVAAAARSVAAAQGVVLGTVLTEAPARLPRWVRRH